LFTWPKSLVTELAERRCIVFLGAGVSAGSEATVGRGHPPDWQTFLSDATGLITQVEDRDEAQKLISLNQYLDAAQITWDSANSADISGYLRQIFVLPGYKASTVHKLVHEIDPKIVVTTNYDQIYENYCHQFASSQAYNVCKYYETHALNDIRSSVRCILKAHGSISDPTRIVLTRSSYFEARRRYPEFYAILDSLFLTNTLLFIGAGLSDPDIQLILENANIAARSVHPHYALVPGGRHRSLVEVIKKTYNIELLEYAADRHDEAVEALADLRGQVLSSRLLPA
jgi:hypothetical protein